MAPIKAVNLELDSTQQAILQRQLDSGHYSDASDVFAEALLLLDEHRAEETELLRAKVEASLANNKPSIPIDTVFERLEARHKAGRSTGRDA